jgi:uncharacterized protein
MAVRMELSRILIRELNDWQLIELREVAAVSDQGEDGETQVSYQQVEGGRSFPIVIGLTEAQAIERRLKGVVLRRPQTHELISAIMASLGAKLESITITDLSDQTFFAELAVRTREGTVVKIDSRPSDAIALGIGAGVPLFVAEHVLDQVQKDKPPE